MNTAVALARQLWIFTGTHLWQSTLVLAAIFVLGLLLRSAPARFPYLLWWSALAKLILPLSLLAPLGQFLAGLVLPSTRTALPAVPFVTTLRVFLDPLGAAESPKPGSSTLGGFLWLGLTLLWVVGAAWMFRRGLRDLGSAHAAQAVPIPGTRPKVRSRIVAALAGTAIPAGRIRVTASEGMPSVAGLFQPVIVVPERACLELEPAELQAILHHEDAHRRRYDPLLGVLQRTLLAFFFYYPPLWIVLHRIRTAAEFTCDERAAQGSTARETYAGALAKLLSLGLESGPTHAAAGFTRPSLLRERFNRIREPWRYQAMLRHSIVLSAGIALIVIASFSPLIPTAQVSATPASPSAAAEGASLAAVPAVQRSVKSRDPEVGDKPILVEGDMNPPQLIEKTQPEYPVEARRANIQGKVVLEAVINTSGDVEDLKVLRSVPALDEAAVAAVKQWKYSPAMRHGEPVKVYFTVVIDFWLDRPKTIVELGGLEKEQETVTLEFKQEPLGRLFDALERISGITIELRGDFPDDLRATLIMKETTLRAALEDLAERFGLRYEVKDPTTLVVIREKEQLLEGIKSRTP